MDFKPQKEIYKRIKRKGMTVAHACEVGVYLPKTSNIVDFIYDDQVEKITLVEPNPRIVKEIEEEFAGIEKIKLHPVAVHEYEGTLALFEAEASTFAEGLPASPALVNDHYEKEDVRKLETKCTQFVNLDSGDIDLLSIDTEGCEWYVLKTMKSRPKIISIETHGKFYVNPFLSEIKSWMGEQGYLSWYKTRSDTVYINSSIKSPSLMDKLKLHLMNIWLKIRRAKKIFYK